MYIPTQEQYLAALEVVKSYELNQDIIFGDKVEAVKKRLDEYFKSTEIKRFRIETKDWMGNRGVFITPLEPWFDEDYCGEFDADLDKMSEEFGVVVKMDSKIYTK